MMAGLVASSRGKFADRPERGGQEYAEYLRDGREAAIEALEYALEHGVDAVDDELTAVGAQHPRPGTSSSSRTSPAAAPRGSGHPPTTTAFAPGTEPSTPASCSTAPGYSHPASTGTVNTTRGSPSAATRAAAAESAPVSPACR